MELVEITLSLTITPMPGILSLAGDKAEQVGPVVLRIVAPRVERVVTVEMERAAIARREQATAERAAEVGSADGQARVALEEREAMVGAAAA